MPRGKGSARKGRCEKGKKGKKGKAGRTLGKGRWEMVGGKEKVRIGRPVRYGKQDVEVYTVHLLPVYLSC